MTHLTEACPHPNIRGSVHPRRDSLADKSESELVAEVVAVLADNVVCTLGEGFLPQTIQDAPQVRQTPNKVP